MERRIKRLRDFIIDNMLDAVFVNSNANIKYLSGFTGTSGYILITETEALMITDFRYMEQVKQQCSGFDAVIYSNGYIDVLGSIIRRLDVKRLGIEDKSLTYHQYIKIKDKLERVDLIPLGGSLDGIRMVKDAEELKYIRRAAEIADHGFRYILDFIKPGVMERDISVELEYYMRKQGISSPSFEFIVASGKRSALPHGVAGNKLIDKGDLVVLDFGGIYEGYCSDMTRTVVVGTPEAWQREIYDVVLKAQQKALASLVAGMRGSDIDSIARNVIRDAGYGENFGHGVGHGVGLLVHEGPVLSCKSDVILEQGMVVTIEPGIYITDHGGVRIEDLVVINERGIENFTQSSKEFIAL